jgi:hypothetical protein
VTKTCPAPGCGVERKGEPTAWESCRAFEFGLDEDLFADAWNAASVDQQLTLRVVWLLDQKRAAIKPRLATSILAWLKDGSEIDQTHLKRLRILRRRLEEETKTLSLEEFAAIKAVQ